jgi:hypothetical protein
VSLVPRHNGIALGPSSPLLTKGGAKRVAAKPTEEHHQVTLMRHLVGPVKAGADRTPGAGLTAEHPELDLLYAIPNSGAGKSKGMAGRMKAMGTLRGICDLCLPCARGPFHGLYVEMKRPGETSRPEQRRVQERLRAEGHAVVECSHWEEARDAILAYLELPKNRPSVRPIANNPLFGGSLMERIDQWRRWFYVVLTGEVPGP